MLFLLTCLIVMYVRVDSNYDIHIRQEIMIDTIFFCLSVCLFVYLFMC